MRSRLEIVDAPFRSFTLHSPTPKNIADRQIIWEEIFDFGGNFKSLNFKFFDMNFILLGEKKIF